MIPDVVLSTLGALFVCIQVVAAAVELADKFSAYKERHRKRATEPPHDPPILPIEM